MPPERLQSLDHVRGFAILGMIAVNFLGPFTVMPEWLRHHQYGFSFAETIAPLFVFVAGMGFRISFLGKVKAVGLAKTRRTTARRFALLVLLGGFCYAFATYFSLERNTEFFQNYFSWGLWEPLVYIGYAGLLSVLVADKAPLIRFGYAVLLLLLFQGISDLTPYGPWLQKNGGGGGPLGGLSWTFPFLFGTIAADTIKMTGAGNILSRILFSAASLMSTGVILSWYWPISKPMTSISFTALTTGSAYLYLLFFLIVNDIWKKKTPLLSVLGKNALTVYLFQGTLMVFAFDVLNIPDATRLPFALLTFVAAYSFSYLFARFSSHYQWRIPL